MVLFYTDTRSTWFESINQTVFYSFPRFVCAKIHVAERSLIRAKVVCARMPV